jgi:aspartate/methionine/tyrosine aminotransferase
MRSARSSPEPGVLKVDDVSDVESWRHVPGVRADLGQFAVQSHGEVLSAAQLTSIVAAARQIGAVVLSDECYALMSWCSDASPSALSANVCAGAPTVFWCCIPEQAVEYGGLPHAFIAGDKRIIDEMSVYRKQIGQIISGPVQAAMVAALRDTTAVFRPAQTLPATARQTGAGLGRVRV